MFRGSAKHEADDEKTHTEALSSEMTSSTGISTATAVFNLRGITTSGIALGVALQIK
jgi:hypothetical protein